MCVASSSGGGRFWFSVNCTEVGDAVLLEGGEEHAMEGEAAEAAAQSVRGPDNEPGQHRHEVLSRSFRHG